MALVGSECCQAEKKGQAKDCCIITLHFGKAAVGSSELIMQSVGEKLREERLRKGITLEDISARTRITVKNLQAIENDDLSTISSPFFYKSFVRQFAQRLSLDYQELADAVQCSIGRIPEPLLPGQVEPILPKIARVEVQVKQKRRTRSFRWVFSFLTLIAVLTGCSTLYAMWENSKDNLQGSVSSFVKSLKP